MPKPNHNYNPFNIKSMAYKITCTHCEKTIEHSCGGQPTTPEKKCWCGDAFGKCRQGESETVKEPILCQWMGRTENYHCDRYTVEGTEYCGTHQVTPPSNSEKEEGKEETKPILKSVKHLEGGKLQLEYEVQEDTKKERHVDGTPCECEPLKEPSKECGCTNLVLCKEHFPEWDKKHPPIHSPEEPVKKPSERIEELRKLVETKVTGTDEVMIRTICNVSAIIDYLDEGKDASSFFEPFTAGEDK